MKCSKCQAEIPEGAKFCTFCGEPAVQDNNQTKAPAAEDSGADGPGAAEAAAEEVAPTEAAQPLQAASAEAAQPLQAASAEAAQPLQAAPAEAAQPLQAAPAEAAPAEAAQPLQAAPTEAAQPPQAASAEAAQPLQAAPAEAAQPPQAASAEAAQPLQAALVEAAPVEAAPAEVAQPPQAAPAEVAQPPQAAPAEAAPPQAAPAEAASEAPQPPRTPQPAYSPAIPADGGSKGGGKSFTKIIIGVIAAIIVISAVAVAAIKLTAKNPKEVVIAAFENIHPKDEVLPGEELFGTSEFVKNAQEASAEGGLTLKLSGCSDLDIKRYSGSGIRIEGKEDKETKENSINIGAIYNGMDLLNLNAYYGNEKVIVGIPELSSKAFTLDLSKDLAQQMKNSPTFGPMAEALGFNIDDFAAYLDELQKQVEPKAEQPFDLAALMNRYKEGCKAEANFKAALTVTKGEKKNFTMNGSEVSCRGYETLVSKAAMIEFLNTSSDFFLQDEQLRQDFLNQLKMTVKMSELMGETMGTASAETLAKQTYDEAEQTAEKMITYLDESLDDVKMTVYVDKKGHMAALEGTTVLHVDDKDLDVKFSVELKGGAYLTQNFDGTVEVTYDSVTGTAAIHRAGVYDGNKLTDDIGMKVAVTGGGKYEFAYTTTYTKDSGDYQVGMNLYGDGSEILDISLKGVIDELEKGKTFHTDIDELKIALMDGNEYVTVEGEYYYRPLENSPTVPRGDSMDVMTATYDDWNDVADEMYRNVFGLLMQLQ